MWDWVAGQRKRQCGQGILRRAQVKSQICHVLGVQASASPSVKWLNHSTQLLEFLRGLRGGTDTLST